MATTPPVTIDPCTMLNSTANVTGMTICNATTTGAPQRPQGNDTQQLIIYILTTVITGLGMIGIGATVHYRTLWSYIKKPKAYLLGVAMQLLILPPLAWALTRIFVMPTGEALGVFIQGSSPGGTTSNIVVYWLDGIVDLSVAMTVTSTLLAMGMMPLWLLIYSKGEQLGDDFFIPFDRLAISLSVLLVTIFLGMIVHVKLPKRAPIISKVLIILASIFIVVMVIVNNVLNQIPWIVTWRQGVVAALMPILAFVFGYLVTIIPGVNMSRKCSRTVSIETALQNVQLASGVIQISFGSNPRLLVQMLLFPLLYYIFQIGYSALFAGLYVLAKRKGWVKLDEEVEEEKAGNDNAIGPNDKGKANEAFQEESSLGGTYKVKENVDYL